MQVPQCSARKRSPLALPGLDDAITTSVSGGGAAGQNEVFLSTANGASQRITGSRPAYAPCLGGNGSTDVGTEPTTTEGTMINLSTAGAALALALAIAATATPALAKSGAQRGHAARAQAIEVVNEDGVSAARA